MISHNLLLSICFYILSFSIAFASVTANWNWDFGQRSILFIFVQFNSEPFSKLKAFLCQIRWEHFNREWTRIFWSHFNLATTWQNLFFRFEDTFNLCGEIIFCYETFQIKRHNRNISGFEYVTCGCFWRVFWLSTARD